PTYGNPVSDNWFVCFDSVYTFLPSMIIGRLPVEDPVQAAQVVSKVIQYDSYTPGEWNKKFLFMTGGNDAGEQASFDALSGSIISQYIAPPPIGGLPLRVSKTSTAPIDSSHKLELNAIVSGGVGFVNFLGHSAGSVWSLDIGNPALLGNTNGMLPFVASVSCNVSSFADQTATNLSEQFVLAPNGGAIAMWGSVSLGYAYPGVVLTDEFLSTIINDSVRALGALTTTARYKLWQASGSDFITIGMVKLTPLLGDPLTNIAIPTLPDLAVSASDMSVSPPVSAISDSAARINIIVHNYGLVPADSVGITLSDFYNGQPTQVLNNAHIAPTYLRDSVSVRWRGTSQAGPHTLRATLDPAGAIREVSKANNSAAIDQYVYGNHLYQVRPFENMVVSPGPQLLRVTIPIGLDSAASQVEFQVDTTSSFASPFVAGSGPVATGPVSAEWTTPSIPDGRVCWWRVRTSDAGATGPWEVFTFSTSGSAPALPVARWREDSAPLFGSGTPVQTAATDSGMILGKLTPIDLYVRSVGARADQSTSFFSLVRADGQSTTGYPWLAGNGFICAVVDATTGVPRIRVFDTPSSAAQSDSMVSFLSSALPGNYVCAAVITDGYTNTSPALKAALKGLGSTFIDSVRSGDAWSIIARAGGNSSPLPLEHWTRTATTADSIRRTEYLPYGSGTFTGPLLPMPQRLSSFRWSPTTATGTNSLKTALLGIRSGGTTDTLRVIPKDSLSVDLTGLNQAIADPAYTGFRAAALFATADPRVTPVLRQWGADFEPPADLAISARTLASPKVAAGSAGGNSVTVTVYNIGYRNADSARIVVSALQADKSFRAIAYAELDSIAPGSFRTV
ncbi:MAG TPA: C25 family cysteine peptidase, partial [Bacteroidota bacterium]|nr:C25 family cysteine peptidase [Bacteroidota bacterium]